MTTMLERAARALAAEDARRYEESSGRKVDLYAANPEMHKRLARAVLMAVREPSGGMLEAERQRQWDVHGWMYAPPKETFTAMIDAILEDAE